MAQSQAVNAATIVIPVLNEVQSFAETLDAVIQYNQGSIKEILIVVGARTSRESIAVAEKFQTKHPGLLEVVTQKRPCLGGALCEGMMRAKGDLVATMFSDLESDPVLLPDLLRAARNKPGTIVQASRVMKGGAFHGYGRFKLALNLAAQRWLRLMYQGKATDFTFGYRVYPRAVAQSLPVREFLHGFVLESLLLAIRQGVPVHEIPCVWRKRAEGSSQITLATYLHYLPLAVRTRFRRSPAEPTLTGEEN